METKQNGFFSREQMEEIFNQIISVERIDDFGETDTDKVLYKIGLLIDVSGDLGKPEGIRLAIKLLDELRDNKKIVKEQLAMSHYFSGCAWSSLKELTRKDSQSAWDWEQEEIEKEVSHLRKALNNDHFTDLPKIRQCQILTNLGNAFNRIGRFVEAIEYYDRAIEVSQNFGMSLGNKGICLFNYANYQYDKTIFDALYHHSHKILNDAIKQPLEGDEKTKEVFLKFVKKIETHILEKLLNEDTAIDMIDLKGSQEEATYRTWCLKNRLFLNPLNDIEVSAAAAEDNLFPSGVIVSLGEGPYFHSLFNLIKQEFVSARYFFYEGVHAKTPHFSDKNVLLFNTLDYPSHSLAVERIKASYRIVYSIFDKIAYFLNFYLSLGKNEKKISFRTVWYEDTNKKEKELLEILEGKKNLLLRGLFWLSKDLFEKKEDFMESLEPDARKLHEIRNRLEHRYFKLHDYWTPSLYDDEDDLLGFADPIVYAMGREEFISKSLKLLKLVRSSIMYLCFAIQTEEFFRKRNAPSQELVFQHRLDIIEDEWKR